MVLQVGKISQSLPYTAPGSNELDVPFIVGHGWYDPRCYVQTNSTKYDAKTLQVSEMVCLNGIQAYLLCLAELSRGRDQSYCSE